jgi:hypothetical protein
MIGDRVQELEESNLALRRSLTAACDRAVAAKNEADRYKKLYESATKRKQELFLGLIAAKRALEEVA